MVRRVLRGHLQDTRHLYLATEGIISSETCFNPDNMARILGSDAH
jgi:hypothetical protein